MLMNHEIQRHMMKTYSEIQNHMIESEDQQEVQKTIQKALSLVSEIVKSFKGGIPIVSLMKELDNEN